jgi:hypothetical protein
VSELSIPHGVRVRRYEWSPAVYLLIIESWLLAVALSIMLPSTGVSRYLILIFALAPGCTAIRERASLRATYLWSALLGGGAALGALAFKAVLFPA